jgi:hypothetical protein
VVGYVDYLFFNTKKGTREMNANELADKLQELDSKLHLIELFKSATMLRQQAERITDLEKQNDRLLTIAEDFKLIIEAQARREK